ncbi:MAG: TonB-dependent receptor plug domain-containing protein, partial [Acidobacteria bacterium]|nr:TonB-dependent receptor plug domain-containing protein [Acidobacteriota bacterium]
MSLASPAHGAPDEPPETALTEMSLEELLSVTVVSASNTSEKLAEAPATVIVITRDDLAKRGYTELSQVLDDLPGMQVVRPYGATYLKNYWRGFRNTIGDPFLLLLDGVVLNHLYFNTADVLVTLPLSNVARVEVVYGPASSIYGPNAFMGVINVITEAPSKNGTSFRGGLTAGSFATRLADVTASYQRDDFSVRLSARFDDGELDSS